MPLETQILTGRELTDDEQYILYGKPASNSMTFFKTDSFSGIVDLMESVFNGDVVNLPFAPKNNCMYLFYDLPVGTKHYFYDINNYQMVDRQIIGDTSLIEMKYRLNTFLLPKILDGMKKIDSSHWKANSTILPTNLYSTVGISKYNQIGEIFSAGLLVNTNGTEVISITSALAKISQTEKTDKTKLNFEHPSLLEGEKKEQLAWNSYCVPTDVQQRCNIPDVSNMSFVELNLPSTYFTWTKDLFFVVSNKYLRLNGFVLNNEIPQLAITHGDFLSNFKLGNSVYLSRAVNTFSNRIEQFIFSGGDSEYNNMDAMFISGVVSGIRPSYSWKNSIVAFNKDVLEISNKPYLHSINYSEHISLDGGVLEDLRESFITAPNNKDTSKYIKSEFRNCPDPLNTESSYASHRYDMVKTSDSKLLFFTKTSKAKDALKQAKISRKITESCSPIINFAIHIFAACDFEFASSDRSTALPTYSRSLTGYANTLWNSFPNEVGARFLKDIDNFKTELVTLTPALAQKSVDSLYSTFIQSSLLNFNEYPSISTCKVQPYYYQRNSFAGCTTAEQEMYCFGAIFKNTANKFNGNIFSPSANNLYFRSLFSNMYANYSYFSPAEKIGLEWEGARFHRYYTNNFISISESLDKLVEGSKNTNWIPYFNEQYVPIATAFTWSQEASDAWSVTRKCKTFNDYYNWYKKLYDILVNRINIVIKPKDQIGAHVLLELAKSYLIVLEGLSVAEAPKLPAPKVKAPKKKPTTITTSTTTEVEEPNDVSDTVEDQESTTLLTAALLQTPLMEEINESDTTRV